MMREVIDEKGIVWVVSVGNEGPALTTLCSPALLDEDIMIGKGDLKVMQYITMLFSVIDRFCPTI